MKPGRPPKAETPYKIIIHTVKGFRYAATKYYKTSKSGKRNHCYKSWGRLLEGNKFEPGPGYLYADVEERKKLIFPEDWDLCEIDKLEENNGSDHALYEKEDVDRQYGTTWLLDNVTEATGLRTDLKTVFNGNDQIVDDVLTLAYFPFIDNLTYDHLQQWQREVKAPSNRTLTSKCITKLTQSITEKNRMDLFQQRASRIGKDELCAVDSTSISSYGIYLVDIRWGKNKERLPLRQTLEVVVYSLSSHQPIYYKELPGNIADCRTIELILTELEHAGFKNLILITDRGYESLKNLEQYITKGQKIITSVKISGSEVMEKIRSIKMANGYPKGMDFSSKDELFYAQYDMQYDIQGEGGEIIHAQNYKLNLYFNPRKRMEEMLAIQSSVQEQKETASKLIETKEIVLDIADLCQRLCFLNLKFNKQNILIKATINQKKIDERMTSSGFFASKSIGVECDALTAKDNYSMRDEQEKTFALQKGPLGKDRLRAWSEAGRHGRMFICFIALIIASYVRKVYSENEWLQKHYNSIEDVLAEMRTIRCIEHHGRTKFITPFVGNQLIICQIFGFKVPESCNKGYHSKRINPAKLEQKPEVDDGGKEN